MTTDNAPSDLGGYDSLLATVYNPILFRYERIIAAVYVLTLVHFLIRGLRLYQVGHPNTQYQRSICQYEQSLRYLWRQTLSFCWCDNTITPQSHNLENISSLIGTEGVKAKLRRVSPVWAMRQQASMTSNPARRINNPLVTIKIHSEKKSHVDNIIMFKVNTILLHRILMSLIHRWVMNVM